jgi:hypothetical protein
MSRQQLISNALGKVVVTFFILSLQSVLHILKLIRGAGANARLAGDWLTPLFFFIVVF